MSTCDHLLHSIRAVVGEREMSPEQFISYFNGLQLILRRSRDDYTTEQSIECLVTLLSLNLQRQLPTFFAPPNFINLGVCVSTLLHLLHSPSKKIKKKSARCLLILVENIPEDPSILCLIGTVWGSYFPGICSRLGQILLTAHVGLPKQFIADLIKCLTLLISVVLSERSLALVGGEEAIRMRKYLADRGLGDVLTLRDDSYISTAYSALCEVVGGLHLHSPPSDLGNLVALTLSTIPSPPLSVIEVAASLGLPLHSLPLETLTSAMATLCRSPPSGDCLLRLHTYLTSALSHPSLLQPYPWDHLTAHLSDLPSFLMSLCTVDLADNVHYPHLPTPALREDFCALLSLIIGHTSLDHFLTPFLDHPALLPLLFLCAHVSQPILPYVLPMMDTIDDPLPSLIIPRILSLLPPHTDSFLRPSLFYLLVLSSSPDSFISSGATLSLLSLSPSPRDLVSTHADYILNKVLFHIRFGHHQSAAAALSSFIDLSPDASHYLEDTVREIADLIDCQSDPLPLLRVILKISRWCSPKMKPETHPRQPRVDILSLMDGSDAAHEVENDDWSPVQSIASVILERSLFWDTACQVVVQRILNDCFLVVGPNKSRSLPLVHKLWPLVVFSLKNQDSQSFMAAFDTLVSLSHICGSFISARFERDVFPLMNMRQTSPLSPGYRSQLSLLSQIGIICYNVSPSQHIQESVLFSLLRVPHSTSSVRQAIALSLEYMRALNPDLTYFMREATKL